MEDRWGGCVVSLNCGPVLGVYQGRVSRVDQQCQSISLVQPFRNGARCTVPELTLSATDIKELKILELPPDPAIFQHTQMPLHNGTAPVAMTNGAQSASHPIARRGEREAEAVDSSSQQQQQQQPPSSRAHTDVPGSTPSKGFRRRHNSWSSSNRQALMGTTPKRNAGGRGGAAAGGGRRSGRDEDCFADDLDDLLDTEFDFEKNLALFDKAAVFQVPEPRAGAAPACRAAELSGGLSLGSAWRGGTAGGNRDAPRRRGSAGQRGGGGGARSRHSARRHAEVPARRERPSGGRCSRRVPQDRRAPAGAQAVLHRHGDGGAQREPSAAPAAPGSGGASGAHGGAAPRRAGGVRHADGAVPARGLQPHGPQELASAAHGGGAVRAAPARRAGRVRGAPPRQPRRARRRARAASAAGRPRRGGATAGEDDDGPVRRQRRRAARRRRGPRRRVPAGRPRRERRRRWSARPPQAAAGSGRLGRGHPGPAARRRSAAPGLSRRRLVAGRARRGRRRRRVRGQVVARAGPAVEPGRGRGPRVPVRRGHPRAGVRGGGHCLSLALRLQVCHSAAQHVKAIAVRLCVCATVRV
ncbi:enhancer of mRNA-decapping protein 3 isoform X1 [Lampetra fluviatilis]